MEKLCHQNFVVHSSLLSNCLEKVPQYVNWAGFSLITPKFILISLVAKIELNLTSISAIHGLLFLLAD